VVRTGAETVFFTADGFAAVPLAGAPAEASDIFAARRAALLLVRGTIVGGVPTLSRALGFGVPASPLVVPLSLLASDDGIKGFPLVAVLGRELVREIGRDGPLAWTEAAEAGRVGGRPPSREERDDARESVDAWRKLKEEGGGAASLLTRNSALRFVRG